MGKSKKNIINLWKWRIYWWQSLDRVSTGDIPCHWMVRVVRVTIINGDVNSQQQWQKHPGDGDTDTLVRPDLSQRIPNQTHQAVTFYSWRDLRLVIFIPGASLMSIYRGCQVPGPNHGPAVTLVTAGPANVGKTALISRFCNDTFNEASIVCPSSLSWMSVM